jgi:hypothetical protein
MSLIVWSIFVSHSLESEKDKWKNVGWQYHYVIRQLRTWTFFSDEAIDEFQNIADDFFVPWLDLTGYNGITNYVHLLRSGHIRYFL